MGSNPFPATTNNVLRKELLHTIKHTELDLIDSTQLLAKQEIGILSTENWHLWTAKGQTSGVGRGKNRCWLSPKDVNIYATYGFLTNSTRNSSLCYISQIAAYSILETLEDFGIKEITFKWPNDVLVEQKKLSGTVVDILEHSKKTNAVLIGIGINVNAKLKDLEGIDQACTSMALATKKNYNIKKVIDTLSTTLKNNVSKLFKEGFTAFHSKINERLYKYNGEAVVLLDEGKRYVSPIKCIGSKGELRLSLYPEIAHYNGQIIREHASL